jgi:predicted branched-subunit amino acid permease
VVAAYAITGAYGSLQAFLGFPAAHPIDLVLVGLWLGLIFSSLDGRRRPLILWPSVVILFLYVALTGLTALTGSNLSGSLLSFRLSAWHLLAIPLIAYAGWNVRTYRGIARGIVISRSSSGGRLDSAWRPQSSG